MRFLAVTWWTYIALLLRSFGNALGWHAAYQGAVSGLTRALARSPESAQLLFWRGTLYWRELREPALGEADLSRAIELAPKLARAHLNRAFARLELAPPDRAGAVADMQAYLALDQDPYWRGVVGEYLQEMGQERVEEPPEQGAEEKP